jgi:hypothetical protein
VQNPEEAPAESQTSKPESRNSEATSAPDNGPAEEVLTSTRRTSVFRFSPVFDCLLLLQGSTRHHPAVSVVTAPAPIKKRGRKPQQLSSPEPEPEPTPLPAEGEPTPLESQLNEEPPPSASAIIRRREGGHFLTLRSGVS